METNRYYAGIGSRDAPEWALAIARIFASKMAQTRYILRSGGADGMDTAFETGCDTVFGRKQIFLPWKGFNGNSSSLYDIDHVAMEASASLHPNWDVLSSGAKKMHTRNVYQITGYNWKHLSSFVICYTEGSGGTQQALRIAKEFDIPVYNLFDFDESDDPMEIINSILSEVLIVRYKLKAKPGFYCKLFNNYRDDGKCNEMSCEFCDDYYNENRKIWWFHPESHSYFLESYANISENDRTALECVDVDHLVKTKVVNVDNHECDVYCGRGSKYKNPFKIGVDGDRKTVIDKFRDYLYNNKELQQSLKQLKGLTLGCHCTPKDCHVDVIAEYIENNF